MNWIERLDRVSKTAIALLSIALVLLIGLFDYLTSTDISLAVVYLVPVSLSAWMLGTRFAIFISFLSIAVWAAGGALAGDEDFKINAFILWWNGAVELISYLALVWALTTLRKLQRDLEERVRIRAAVLTEEIAERERLQRELLEVSEREQRRIGQELHDGLCQHLAGTALAGQVLGEKLASRRLAEAEDAREIVSLIEHGIVLSREIARGLHPLEMGPDGLMYALQEFAGTTSELYKVDCRFECESPVLIHDPDTAAHLYRISQEAVRNAVKHGKAAHIVIRLDTLEHGQLLSVEDDGVGIDDDVAHDQGMGLRIMANRSRMIGGFMEVRARASGGTIATCTIPTGVAHVEASRE